MELNEEQEILKQAGYLCEFRDVSNPLDKRTKEDNYRDSEKSWNNMEALKILVVNAKKAKNRKQSIQTSLLRRLTKFVIVLKTTIIS